MLILKKIYHFFLVQILQFQFLIKFKLIPYEKIHLMRSEIDIFTAAFFGAAWYYIQRISSQKSIKISSHK